MKINAISFVYAARFAAPPKEVGRDHIKGILFEPQKSGRVRLVATNGHTLVVVNDGMIHTADEIRKTWINPNVLGLLAAAKKGEYVTIRPDGIVEVEKQGRIIYVSPESCEKQDQASQFPAYEQVIDTVLEPATRNYSLSSKYLEMFDLGHGVTVYPVGGNLSPLLVQPHLTGYGVEIESAIGVLMPMNQKQDSRHKLPEEYIKTFINRE